MKKKKKSLFRKQYVGVAIQQLYQPYTQLFVQVHQVAIMNTALNRISIKYIISIVTGCSENFISNKIRKRTRLHVTCSVGMAAFSLSSQIHSICLVELLVEWPKDKALTILNNLRAYFDFKEKQLVAPTVLLDDSWRTCVYEVQRLIVKIWTFNGHGWIINN